MPNRTPEEELYSLLDPAIKYRLSQIMTKEMSFSFILNKVFKLYLDIFDLSKRYNFYIKDRLTGAIDIIEDLEL
jgi:hypothetical protein